ncbi:MAG: hypothetical protein JWL72_4657 [Ilumatobacteraceae bacterium]|nr:hypothetical protein [Ilumatobacteraceae bacterium]MCU1391319.1 hypothetical protein [Ilumatobacteraceae bacterium]
MDQLTEVRWRRYGQDRVYVNTADGTQIGHIDLRSETVVVLSPEHAEAMAHCAARWLQPVSSIETDGTAAPVRDLAANVAGAAARAKRDEVHSSAPVLNLIARAFGMKTDERAWRIGAKGEREVGDELAKLPTEWRVLHAVEVGDHGSDIDHVVIGPPGVFTLNTKCHPGGRVWVGEHAVRVNGHPSRYLRNSRFEAERASRLLSRSCGFTVPVRAAIVFVGLDDFKIAQQPTDVDVTTRRRMRAWLTTLPIALNAPQIDVIHAAARSSASWH